MTPAQATSAAAPQAPLQPPVMPAGRPFTISFDGAVLSGTIAIRSARDIDRLMKVLAAQKAAFEAMEDDDDWDTVISTYEPGKEERPGERTSNRIRLNEDEEE